MLKLPLYLNGHYAGKTVKLANNQFTNGKIVLYGSAAEVNSLANYLGKCFQAWPEHIILDPITGAQVERKINHGSSTVQEKGLSDLGPEIREKVGQTEKVPANDGEGANVSDLHKRGDNSSGAGHEDPRVSGTEGGLDGTSAAKIDGDKLLKSMQMLDPENGSHWRQDGLPRVDAVVQYYGSEGLTRKDLQAVWPELTRELKKKEDLKTDISD